MLSGPVRNSDQGDAGVSPQRSATLPNCLHQRQYRSHALGRMLPRRRHAAHRDHPIVLQQHV
jgi:hypothetical protein